MKDRFGFSTFSIMLQARVNIHANVTIEFECPSMQLNRNWKIRPAYNRNPSVSSAFDIIPWISSFSNDPFNEFSVCPEIHIAHLVRNFVASSRCVTSRGSTCHCARLSRTFYPFNRRGKRERERETRDCSTPFKLIDPLSRGLCTKRKKNETLDIDIL